VKSNFEAVPFSLSTASGRQIDSWFDLKSAVFREALPEGPGVSKNELLQRAHALNEIQEFSEWALWDRTDSNMLGFCRIHTSRLRVNNDVASFTIIVRESHRRLGIGHLFLKCIADTARALECKLLRGRSSERCIAGSAFLTEIGAESISASHINQLLLKDIDRSIIRRWLELPEECYCKINVRDWQGIIPEEYIQEVTDLYQIVYDKERQKKGREKEIFVFSPEQIRRGEKIVFAGNKKRIITCATDPNGQLLGLTEISWSPARPGFLFQGYTAVLPDARGIGIGRRLKAEMLRKILNELPDAELIRSGNDDSNRAILNINNELGLGKRQLYVGGRYDSKYWITVPAESPEVLPDV